MSLCLIFDIFGLPFEAVFLCILLLHFLCIYLYQTSSKEQQITNIYVKKIHQTLSHHVWGENSAFKNWGSLIFGIHQFFLGKRCTLYLFVDVSMMFRILNFIPLRFSRISEFERTIFNHPWQRLKHGMLVETQLVFLRRICPHTVPSSLLFTKITFLYFWVKFQSRIFGNPF